MRGLLIVISLGLLAGLASADPIKKVKEKTTAEKVVGKWRLVKSNGMEMNDQVCEFTKEGKLYLTIGTGADADTIEGKYKVEKDSIDYEVSQGNNRKAEVLVIKVLTDMTLTTEDPDGHVEEFERIEEKK